MGRLGGGRPGTLQLGRSLAPVVHCGVGIVATKRHRRRAIIASLVLAFGTGGVLHVLHLGHQELHELPPILHWLRDSALAWPLAAASVLAGAIACRAARREHIASMAWAVGGAVVFALGSVPGNRLHAVLFQAEHSHATFLSHALKDASATLLPSTLLLAAIATVAGIPGGRARTLSSWSMPMRALARRIRPIPISTTLAVLAATILQTGLIVGVAAERADAAVASCNAGTQADRSYDVQAISLDIPFNRWGDHNPNGMAFALEADAAAMKNWHVPLGRDGDGNLDPSADPANAQNRRLRPRPLVLRANEGECVRVTLENRLNPTPGEGLHQDPRVSIHVHGVAYDVQTSDGSRVGANPDTTIAIGEQITYHWLAPDTEGLYFFHDHGGLAGSEADGGSNAHGLYGALAVEPAGSLWFDPVSGSKLYTDTNAGGGPWTGGTTMQSGGLYLEAIIVPPAAMSGGAFKPHDGSIPDIHAPDEVAFRETIQISQDEMPGVNGQEELVGPLGIGLGFNYGIEPLLQRQEPINRCPDCVGEETWLSSWPYGDPALVKLASGHGPWYPGWHPLFPGNGGEQNPGNDPDPEDCGLESMDASGHEAADPAAIPPWASCWTANVTHAYPYDATKLRFAHAGPKETHVFHLHAHQWIADPFDTGNSGGTPGQPGADVATPGYDPEDPGNVDARRPQATTIDSQTFGPGETFTADILFGAGSKPGTIGDSIFHCHLYPHFAEGFWALLRVHDVLEDGTGRTPDGIRVRAIVPLPDRTAAGDEPPSPTVFEPGYPRMIPGEFGWRAPQPLNGVSQPNGSNDDPDTIAREDLDPATRIVAGKALDATLLDATQTITNDATNGTFKLSFGGLSTGDIPVDAPPEDVRTALVALPNIQAATVTGEPRAWIVRLDLWERVGSLELTADDTNLLGGTSTITPSRPDLGDPDIAGVAHRLAIERYVSLRRFNPGYDPADPPTTLVEPRPGAPLVDPCPASARQVTYNVSIIQLDIVYNGDGWHDPNGRVLVLDRDVDAVLSGQKAPEPLFFRVNAGDCINYNLTNRLPNWLGNDDFLELIQTNMVGQHIHLVKFDVTASDGASNGWNNQEAAFTEEMTAFNDTVADGSVPCGTDTFNGTTLTTDGCRLPTPADWNPLWSCSSKATCPAGQTIHERWYADYELRTVFTHDHHFPAEDQNRGYFAALVVEPRGMDMRHPSTGRFFQPINDAAHGTPCADASDVPNACEGTAVGTALDIIGPGASDDFREYGVAIHDFASLYRDCAHGEGCSTRIPGQEPLEAPPEPEGYPDDDPGVFGINYRNAPFLLRNSINGNPVDPAYVFSSTVFGDPDTPVFRAYARDPVRARLIMGAQEEQHVLQIHGMRWRQQPDDPGSPLVNQQAVGVSDAFNFEIPTMECGVNEDCRGDYLYGGTSTDDMWLGAWGILRVFGKGVNGLLPLPDNVPQAANGTVNQNVTKEPPPKANKPGNPCPANAPVKTSDVIAVDTRITYNEAGHNDPFGLVYATVEPGEAPEQAAARVRALNPTPMVMRANEGDCLTVTLHNMIDPAGPFATVHAPAGAADGDPPLVLEPPTGTPAGLRVSLHPALLLYDVRGSDGSTVGFNRDQTVGPGESITYRWFADDVSPGQVGSINLVDYGDVRGHRHHGLFAGLVIEPKDATFHDPYTGEQLTSGQQADIRVPGQPDFREFNVFFQDGLNLRDAGGTPLPDQLDHPPTPEEPAGALPDAEDRGEKGFNYRNADFGPRLGTAPGQAFDDLDGDDLAWVFSSQVHGDPQTPIFRSYAGDPTRLRVFQGSDKPRQHSFQLAGHAWRAQPFDGAGETELIATSGGLSVGRSLNLHVPAGGALELNGDYRYNCGVLFHHQSGGLWGISRVYEAPPAPTDVFEPDPIAPIDDPFQADYFPLMPLELVEVTATVFDDGNLNGARNPNEPPVAGAIVELYEADGATAVRTGTTDATGSAAFHVAPAGYDVKVVPPPDPSKASGTDWQPTTPTSFRVDATSQHETPAAAFGLVRLADVTVVVFDDKDGSNTLDPLDGDGPLAGWMVTVTGGGTTTSSATGADGSVLFDGLRPGTYQASVSAEPGWVPSPPATMPITFTLAEDGSDIVMAGHTRTAGLSVRLFNDSNKNGIRDGNESWLTGWRVHATDEAPAPATFTTSTDGSGIARFDPPLAAGSYHLAQELPASWSFHVASAATTDTTGTFPTPDFACDASSCSTVLVAGTTQVVTIGNHTPKVWVVGQPFNDANNNGSLQGNEKKLVGWPVELWSSDLSTKLGESLTGNNGLATFSFDPGTPLGSTNNYKLKIHQPATSDLDWRRTPATASTAPAIATNPAIVPVSVIAGETATARVGFIQLGTVSANVFHDHDQDGVWDDVEPPLANRNVRLLDHRGRDILQQKVTDANGYAAFQVAANTRYQIQVLLPKGWVATAPITSSGPTTAAKITSSSDPLNSLDPVDFGQWAKTDVTPPPDPTATPPGGSYPSTKQVTLVSETGAAIRYTLNGPAPTPTTGTPYTEAVFIGPGTTTLRAIAIDGAGNVSGVTTEVYSISVPTTSAIATLSGWTMSKGTLTAGTVAALAEDDTSYIVMSSARRGKGAQIIGTGTTTLPQGQRDVLDLTIRYVGWASASGVSRTIELLDASTGAWETISAQTETRTETARSFDVPGDPRRFVSASGEIRVRLTADASSAFEITVDRLAFTYGYV